MSSARLVLESIRGKLIVSGVLPRNDDYKGQPKVPYASVLRVNELLARGVSQLSRQYPGRASFVDCGAHFVLPAAEGVHRGSNASGRHAATSSPQGTRWSLMDVSGRQQGMQLRSELFETADHLHLTEAGHAVWARCLGSAMRSMEESI